jgi:hypothetical protein
VSGWFPVVNQSQQRKHDRCATRTASSHLPTLSHAASATETALSYFTAIFMPAIFLVDSNNKLVAIDPTPAFGDPEQDIADAVAKNDWGQVLPTRVKRLAEACHADVRKVAAYARIAAWNCGIFHTAIRRVSTFEVLTRRVSIIRET